MRFIALLILYTTSTYLGGEGAVCLTSDDKKQPIVFDVEEKTVVYPSASCNRGGELFEGKRLGVLCTGRLNKLLGARANVVSEGNVPYYHLRRGVNKLACERVNKAVTLRDASNDERNCLAYKIGFKMPRGVPFHTVYTVCWDDSDKHPVWVRNVINPAMREDDDAGLIDAGIRTRFKFSPVIFGKDYNPRAYFSVKHQTKVGLRAGGHGDFMARGHLAPAGDFFLACERWATFSLENAVPQWQTHNNGAWKDIENRARHTKGAYLAETGPLYVTPSPHLDPVNNLLPVPDSMYKKVWNKHGALLFNIEDRIIPNI